jgi:octaprenyl-diphosphate synthase
LDNAETRRRKPSANQVWGNHAAVLEGDFLYLKSSDLALNTHNIPFMRKVIDAATRMTEGQILESIHTNDWSTGKQHYMEIISNKTAQLISSACACGGIISDAEPKAVASLDEFGVNMGIAFQLMDDLLDYTALEETMGKPVGKDLREGKITLPLIYTLPLLERSERKRLEALFYSRRATEADYRELIEVVRRNGVLEQIHEEARTYVATAEKSLSPFPPSPSKQGLLALNQYVIQRDH